MTHPTRRDLLQSALAGAALASLPGLSRAQAAAATAAAPAAERRFEPQPSPWRTFELTTTVTVAEVKGRTQLWLPVPDVDTEFQHPLDNRWTGNASRAAIVRDAKAGVRLLHAEFEADVAAPTLSLVSTLQTRNRTTDWSQSRAASEDTALLKANLAPTELLPVDGIVRQTALEATRGAATDVDKARALYQWVVENAHREPKTRGCGTGDIKTMLETGNLGGKCADLNAVFVGLCRSVGLPARDLYGIRLAPSAFGYKELGGNPANLKGAQHCRAEVFLAGHGWVAMDPADVLKVMRQETPDWIKDSRHPVAAPVAKALFGSWEGNWLAWNTGHDLVLPGTRAKTTLPFLMYPNGENDAGRFDEVAADSFKYTISAREIAA
ncbi:MAG: transglutaminase family protein [Leptothrix sp. (in: b-proteobacteria)]